MTGYEYSKIWFDFAFENPDLVTPAHTAVYLWNVELNNRMGWVEKFSSPSSQGMAACGIKSYNTYKKVLNDLIEWGFLNLISESKNQYTANVFALSNFDKAQYKALDKAMTKHSTKQCESTVQSIDSINKQTNQETNKQGNNIEKQEKEISDLKKNEDEFSEYFEEPKIISLQAEENEKEKNSGEKRKGERPEFNLEDVVWPFDSKKFNDTWLLWMSFRKEQKFPKYKPIGLQGCLKNLAEISNGDEETAIKIIQRSIANGWKGLFKIENNNHHGRQANGYDGHKTYEAINAKWGTGRH